MTVSAKVMLAPHAHLLARDPKCDTVTVLNMAARRRPGRRVADMNEVAGEDDDWNLHYPDGPEANHFTHRINPITGKLERIPPELRHKQVLQTPKSEIRTWRKNVGTTKRPKWVRAFTTAERQHQANLRFVTIGWEAKSLAYTHPRIAQRASASLRRAGGSWFHMTLVNMRGWRQKLTNFKDNGDRTALLAHNEPKPADINEFHPRVIDVIDGRWAA